MGIFQSKKTKQKEPDKFFQREKWKADKIEEKRKKNADPSNKRAGTTESPTVTIPGTQPRAAPALAAAPPPTRSYDDEAMETMRFQLHHDCDAFLLNNILLGVQFFENYERETGHLKNNPISEREHMIDEAMVRHHKHVFFSDRLQECVHEHVKYARRRGQQESLSSPRLYVIYDNVEASEPGDTSDYSTVLDAPFYKLLIEDCKEHGYAKLKKLEVLESTLTNKEPEIFNHNNVSVVPVSDDSIYTDSEKESNDSDCYEDYPSKGEALLQQIKSKLNNNNSKENIFNSKPIVNNIDVSERRRSGPIRQTSYVAAKGDIANFNYLRKMSVMLEEDSERRISITNSDKNETNVKGTKSTSKNVNTTKRNGTSSKENNTADDMGYRSNSSRNNESSETESDYGYTTITELTTPKRVELSLQSNLSASSGVLPEECWAVSKVRAIDQWSDEDDEIVDKVTFDAPAKDLTSKQLYDTHYYLNSINFMTNFVDNFMVKLGTAVGLTTDTINNALTQGASIYCDTTKAGIKTGYEIIPAILAAWPNAANHWIIRERKVIVNPRTNLNYQWPTKHMVNKAINLGCLVVPVGFRPKRGLNLDQKFQWRITFPVAEKYLESTLAHSHIRCYLFTLALYKTFMENEYFKMGIDSSHIKNHLFWQCEDNHAGWPEDRLGETLRLFLRRFYDNFCRARLPNYFVESCNDFKGIPTPVLLKLQRRLHDILQSPVMHVLSAIEKLKYTSKDFYPQLNVNRLYVLLTCKNPLRLANPNLPPVVKSNSSSDSEPDDAGANFFDRAKAQDKQYQWKVARRQAQERRKANLTAKKNKILPSTESLIDRNIILPPKMDVERRRLVLEFFIPHFIAMARYSEKFEAIKQAVIYLEQAQRLSKLLLEEPGGDTTANEYIDVIQDDLAECHRKLINQSGYKLPHRRESTTREINRETKPRQRPKFSNIVSQDSPTDTPGIAAFTFADVHSQPPTNNVIKINSVRVENDAESEEESKL